jgi:hypothetical protein
LPQVKLSEVEVAVQEGQQLGSGGGGSGSVGSGGGGPPGSPPAPRVLVRAKRTDRLPHRPGGGMEGGYGNGQYRWAIEGNASLCPHACRACLPGCPAGLALLPHATAASLLLLLPLPLLPQVLPGA